MLPIESDIRTQLHQEDRHREASKERNRLHHQREVRSSTPKRFSNPFRSHQPAATPHIAV
jgi:hypothetical protein